MAPTQIRKAIVHFPRQLTSTILEAIKHNQQIPHNHFRKDWQRRVRTHFDQPGSKKRRRQARIDKAAKVAPRPVDKLRPVVRCPSIKYNRRVRAGRGFSLAELKAAGIPRKLAPTIGISVDPRRQNISEESLAANVERLNEYKGRLILFPRRVGKTKSGDASVDDVKAAKSGENILRHTGTALPITNAVRITEGNVKDYPSEENAYKKLRIAKSDARLVGVREKRSKAKAEEAAASKK
ncbi:60S ribosomal protein L13 [Rhizodiscina lignyota]|uniref:60S ribosomal protein L13 n=1 Tax=Rhizodiscina lignyota TaxID=1504668 RepID=A0A9P4M4F0_9PEZI|nr:60S ribosomal protein L13 [Rhizodiscina lignyota]